MMASRSVHFNFSGLMAPVFNSFKDDECLTVEVENIKKYAEFLKENGVNGILVNGTTGEGPSLNVAERKQVTELWSIAARKHSLTLMVQIGGAPLPDVIELAKHAEMVRVDAVLCLPELYFKPKTHTDLIAYLKRVAYNCPTCPFLYYHIPAFTGLNFHMPTFCVDAQKEMSNFVGIKYTSNDLDMGSECLKYAENVMLGADTLLSCGLLLGFKSAILTTLNIYPEMSVKIIQAMSTGNMSEAKRQQCNLTKNVRTILAQGNGEWVASMKRAFNLEKANIGLSAGLVRI